MSGHRLLPVLVLLLSCDDSATPTSTPAAPQTDPDPAAAQDARTEEAQAPPMPAVKPTVVEEPPEPAPQLVETDTWPFVEWDHAKAVVFNLERGPGLSLYAYNASKGWNTRIHSEQDVTEAQAEQAIALASRTLGTLLVSKCALPRHGIVLFAGETPVASINVCFECGDILVWPKWDPAPDWSDRKDQMRPKLQKAYDRTFPKWERYFSKTLGLELDYTRIAADPSSP